MKTKLHRTRMNRSRGLSLCGRRLAIKMSTGIFGWMLVGCIFLLIACGSTKDEVKPISQVREGSKSSAPSDPGLGTAERLGFQPSRGGELSPTGLEWQTLAGWREVAPTPLRNPNFILDDQADAQCFVTTGFGGGVLANVNRWRSQMGQSPLSDDSALEGEQKLDVLGNEAILVNLKGTFRGMDGEPKDDYQLMGCLVEAIGGRALSVKMIGPAAVLGKHEQKFVAFCQSLKFSLPVDHPPLTPPGQIAGGGSDFDQTRRRPGAKVRRLPQSPQHRVLGPPGE